MSRELLRESYTMLLFLPYTASENKQARRDLLDRLNDELAKPEQASNEPPDYVEPPTSDYHNGWEEGFEAAKNLFKGRNT